MALSSIHSLLFRGEGIEVEFKEAFFELPKSTFETVCAFLDRRGGHLLLGVKNNGVEEGALESEAARMLAELTTNANNGQKLSSPFYLSPEVVVYEGKTLIYCYVPQSSQVHRTAGRIFDRTAADGDIDSNNQPHSVTQLYLRK